MECLFLSAANCEELWPYTTAGAACDPFEGTFSSRSKTLIPSSRFSPAVVDADFQTERTLVDENVKCMNKT